MDKEIIEELQKIASKPTPQEFIQKLFQSRDIAHLAHLKTKNYAAHRALNKYYDTLLDRLDSFVESYQGLYGIINLTIPASTAEEPVKHLETLHSYIETNKKIFTDSALLNQIDEFKTLIQTTLYKLKYLS